MGSVELTPGKSPLNSQRIIVDTREPGPAPMGRIPTGRIAAPCFFGGTPQVKR